MPIHNQRGQMAVFIALFFQVLFVFFAMAINVGLVVHDKINLQNAVDLAAYYGAAKQAEILNQIAHINFQMRQNYKLFTWRYRVLGTLGSATSPLNPRSGIASILPESNAPETPSVCVANPFWQEYQGLGGSANFCLEPERELPNIRVASGGSGLVPGYSSLVSFTQMANQQFINECHETGIFNWMYAARILVHFRVEGLVRKNMVRRLAASLSSQSPLDLRGESIEEGARNTFQYNLTDANRAGIQEFRYFNSMSSGQCANVDFWLPEVRINPVIMFMDLAGTRANCTKTNVVNRDMPERTTVYQGRNNLPSGFSDPNLASRFAQPNATLIEHWSGEPSASTGLHSSIGFEKNPWCMVYSGVRATTQVRKPFSPTGGVVTLTAQGYAQPFGGRIGPWYGRTWPQGAPNSQAGSGQDKVDPLLPSRDVAGSFSAANGQGDIANHARYPGDQLGYLSPRTYTSMFQQFRGRLSAQLGTRAPLAWGTYNHLGGRPSLESLGDSLAREAAIPDRDGATTVNVAPQREFELAIASPDPFEAFYFSVEPRYFNNYFTANTTNSGALIPNNEQIYDVGSTKDGLPGWTQQTSVIDQVNRAQSLYDAQYEHTVRNWHHLLTSWHQRGAVDFGMDPGRFGRCETEVTNQDLPTTGNCLYGGTTGYAVKNVSVDFLRSSEHAVGGGSGISGPILNPPNF